MMSGYEQGLLSVKAAKVVDGELYLAVQSGLRGVTIAFRTEIWSVEVASLRGFNGADGQIVLRIIAAKEQPAGSPDVTSALDALALPPPSLKNTTPESG